MAAEGIVPGVAGGVSVVIVIPVGFRVKGVKGFIELFSVPDRSTT
jgi:hypothetical protein